jgi:hypothetical protein
MRRWIPLAISMSIALAGATASYTGCIARGRYEPCSVRWGDVEYRIVRHTEGEAIQHEFIRGQQVAAPLEGSTDTMCDEPYIMVIDVNGDGRDDVYHHHCSGRDYLTFVPARQTLEHVNLGSFEIDDAPTLTSFWATEIRRWHGLRLIVGGGLVTFVGIIATAIFVVALVGRRRPRPAGSL